VSVDLHNAQKHLESLEAKLADVRERLSKATLEMNRLNHAADKGDRKAAYAAAEHRKQIASDGRLVLSIQREIGEAKKRIGYIDAQAAAMARQAQAVANAALEKARLFEVRTPDGRLVRHAGCDFVGRAVGRLHSDGRSTWRGGRWHGRLQRRDWLDRRGISGLAARGIKEKRRWHY
jgi:hypothetical protein